MPPFLFPARGIATFDPSLDSDARLMLSGSRGIGGVTLTTQGVTSLELLDLEEDEEEDVEEEEDEEEDE
jgi:CRISPR/Cas system CSM-associated protein Csm3 (group 7 of RAMP superfamily)